MRAPRASVAGWQQRQHIHIQQHMVWADIMTEKLISGRRASMGIPSYQNLGSAVLVTRTGVSAVQRQATLPDRRSPPPPAAKGHETTSTIPWGFVSTRLDSRSSQVVYTGYAYGAAFIVGASLENPRTGYSEQLIGAGARGRLGAGSQFVVAAVAKAPESRYLQFYYLPTVEYRALTVGTTVEAYVPLNRTGLVQLAVVPLTGSHTGDWTSGSWRELRDER